MDNGLRISDLGLRGLIVETVEPAYSQACRRHEAVQLAVPAMTGVTLGARVLITALGEGLILSTATLAALAGVRRVQLYARGYDFEVELQMEDGWRDRRVLPARVVAAIRENRGIVVTARDITAAAKVIAALEVYAMATNPLLQAISDAQAWWFGRLPGPLFAHLTRLRPFQVLDRAARARTFSKQPQRSPASKVDPLTARMAATYDGCFKQSLNLAVIQELITELGRIARAKPSKPQGREQMLALVQKLMPKAMRAGRAQVLVLAGVTFILVNGGVRGGLLAPVSMYEYSRQHLEGFTVELIRHGIDGRSGEDWLACYRAMLSKVEKSQVRKLAAFFEAFHSFFVVVGLERLPSGIATDHKRIPPAAAIVTDHELLLALAFVQAHGETEKLVAQASIALLLAFEIALRTYELWCIRMVDVQLLQPSFLVIYPRERDGAGKNPSVRRQEDLRGKLLIQLLVAFKHERLTKDLAVDDEDLFFGEPGDPEVRHEQEKTMRLVNAALAWASGNRIASYYDLRHTVFSRKAEPVLFGS